MKTVRSSSIHKTFQVLIKKGSRASFGQDVHVLHALRNWKTIETSSSLPGETKTITDTQNSIMVRTGSLNNKIENVQRHRSKQKNILNAKGYTVYIVHASEWSARWLLTVSIYHTSE